jgi:hypothetical protein
MIQSDQFIYTPLYTVKFMVFWYAGILNSHATNKNFKENFPLLQSCSKTNLCRMCSPAMW